MQMVYLHEISKPVFFSKEQKEKQKDKKTYFFCKSMRSGTTCTMIISGAHIIPKLKEKIWICDITNQFSDITNSLLFSDITKSN